jgi:hypothetical protein
MEFGVQCFNVYMHVTKEANRPLGFRVLQLQTLDMQVTKLNSDLL